MSAQFCESRLVAASPKPSAEARRRERPALLGYEKGHSGRSNVEDSLELSNHRNVDLRSGLALPQRQNATADVLSPYPRTMSPLRCPVNISNVSASRAVEPTGCRASKAAMSSSVQVWNPPVSFSRFGL